MRQACIAAMTLATVLSSAIASAQEPKSSAGARELAQVLAQKKLDAIAARDPAAPDAFVAALYFPGQLLVMSATYPAPPLLNERLARREYRDVYIEMNSASLVASRMFVTDIGADGLQREAAKRDGPFDIRDSGRQVVQLRRQLARKKDVGGRLHEGVRRGRRPLRPGRRVADRRSEEVAALAGPASTSRDR